MAYLFLDVFIIGAFGWAEIQTAFVETLVALACTWVKLNVVTIELFVFLAISEILILLANKIVFYAIRGKRTRIRREMVKEKKVNSRKSFESGNDITILLLEYTVHMTIIRKGFNYENRKH